MARWPEFEEDYPPDAMDEESGEDCEGFHQDSMRWPKKTRSCRGRREPLAEDDFEDDHFWSSTEAAEEDEFEGNEEEEDEN